MKRQHPAAMIGYTSKNFWLLLIPLIRGLIAYSFDFYRWIDGAGWDILIVTLMFAIACLRWYTTFFAIKDNSVRIVSGWLFRRDIQIPLSQISAVTAEENPLYRKFGAVSLHIDTDAATQSKKYADIRLTVLQKDKARLFNLLSSKLSGSGEKMNYTYKVSKLSLIVFSLLFSSVLSGVILIVTTLSGGTKIAGEHLESRFLEIVTDLSDAVAQLMSRLIGSISPAGISISIIIAAGFVLSFAINIIRHINFTVTRRGKCILISGGFVTKRTYCLNSERINIADMRQNLLMKLFGITSVHVNCTGYGKRKNEFPVFVPICSIKNTNDGKSVKSLSAVMEMLLPGFTFSESYINPAVKHIMRFILPPALLVFGILVLGMLMFLMHSNWHELIAFLTLMCEIPAVWLMFVKACAYCTNGINITQDSICAKYCTWYDFHTITVPLERVAEIRIKQNFFQKFNCSCDVIIFTNSEYIGGHKIKSMPIAEVQELIRERFK
ncbi:MAG: PH domain-containing protein [Oscillospiraceae bacterium]|nr:PH domain-containing protein [Oscillospiraceae bacterium]